MKKSPSKGQEQLTSPNDDYETRKLKLRRRKIINSLSFALGFLLLLIGVLCAVFRIPEELVDRKFRSVLTLSPDSDVYHNWVEPTIPIYMKFYVFNVTNPEEIISGEKPKLKECGPFTYQLKARKENVTFYPNSTVYYYNKYSLHYDPDQSSGSLNDSMHMMNIPLASMAVMLHEAGVEPSAFGSMQDFFVSIGGDKLFPKRTPYEILFGYHDPIFNFLSQFGVVEESHFGLFKDFNNSKEGPYLMYTGQKKYERSFEILKWHGDEILHFWSSKYANMINGTDGSFLGRYLTENDTPYIFLQPMCRSIKLEHDGTDIIKGITTFKFRDVLDLFANRSINPDNAGFCTPLENCHDSGVLDASVCAKGAPTFISYPHFYNAAEKYQKAIIGLSPDKKKHESYYYAEPVTGAVLKSSRRLQINMHLKPTTGFNQLNNVTETIFPILWIETEAEVNEKTVTEMRTALNLTTYIWLTSYFILGSGILVLLFSVVQYRSRYRLYIKLRRQLKSAG